MKPSMNILLVALAISVLGLLGLTPGCGGPPSALQSGPSYAELLSIYNSELAALDRLERKREELVKSHEAQLLPSTEEAAEALSALLTSAGEAGNELNLDTADPDELLDRAVEHAEKTQEITAQLLETASSQAEPSEEEAQRRANLTEQFEQELAALDAEIAEQKARVDRARTARDAAEAAQ